MKKKIAVMLTGALTVSMLLSGCQASKGLETDELKITQYEGVEVEEVEKPAEITDEEVDAAVQSNLEANASSTEVTDRAVEEGDTVTIDFVGTIDGEEFDGGSSEDYPLTIGSGTFIEGFEESIVGHEIGDTFDWNGSFPEEYGNTDYAGKDVTFTITVKGITEENIPELNDEFVQSVSEKSKTVDEYREEVKADLEEDAQNTYMDTLMDEAWTVVMDNTEVKKYSDEDIAEISDSLIEQYKTAAEYYSMEYEDFIEQQMGSTVEEFEAQVEEAAKSSVKQDMVTNAIAEKENLVLSDDELQKEYEQIALDYGYEDVEAMKEAAEEEDIKKMAQMNVVKEWIADKCVQVKASTTESDTAEESEGE